MNTSIRDGYAEPDFANAENFDDDKSFIDQLDLQHYLRILRKFKWFIVLFTAVVTALAGYYAYTATPIYISTSTLLIESQGNNYVQFEELVGLDTENQDYYQTQYEILRSRGLALRVVEHLDLWSNPELAANFSQTQIGNDTAPLEEASNTPDFGSVSSILNLAKDAVGLQGEATAGLSTQSDPGAVVLQPTTDLALVSGGATDLASLGQDDEKQQVVANFMGRLTIAPIRKTKLVKISFESADPVLAANVANAMAEQYIESYLDAKLELTTQATEWLNNRLGTLKAVLDESEDRLIAFKVENGLVDVGGSVGRLNEQELLLTTAELAQARSELAGKADLFRDVQSLQGNPELLLSIASVQADPLVQNVKVQQGQAQRILDELRNRYGERHPRVVDATSQLASLNTSLEGHIARVVGSISKEYQLVRQKVASIEQKLASGKQEIQLIGTKKFELDELSREATTNRAIYDEFFSRISEAKSADGLERANARVSDPAVTPRFPIKPKKQLIIALAALASLLMSMLMALLYEQMDDTVKGTQDIERKLDVPLLGILPLIKSGLFKTAKALPLNPQEIQDAKGTFVEAVSTIRTALCIGDGTNPRKIIMVTSSVPSEGKSTTSLNLAYSFGQLERVLLIDCDMRRPTIAKAAGLDKNTAGLSNLITRSASAQECIKQRVFGDSIDILPSGPIPDQPLELLSSKRFEKILSQLSEHYDRIIIDCAPTQAVSDAMVLSKLSDGVVYCIKSHDTSIDMVKRGLKRLRQMGAPIAGCVVTQVDVDKIVSYGGDYYYQGYYDYYGYTEKGVKNSEKSKKLRLSKEELMAIREDDSDYELDFAGIGNSNSSADRRQSSGNEFDLTADINDLASIRLAEGQKTNRRRGKVRGDLDIL